MYYQMRWLHTYMCIVNWDINVLSSSNKSPLLSTCKAIGYLTTTLKNYKIAQTNIILEKKCVISEYSDSVTDTLTNFLFIECNTTTNPFI